jgi:membrane-associated protease RseP (regulator of RpoE activity)
MALVAAAASALGCTTLGKPAEQVIRIETPGCVEASCQLSNESGTWRVDRTPGQVTVLTSKDPLIVRCERGAEATAGVHAPARSGTKGAGAVGGGAVGGTAVGVALGSTVFAVIPALGVMAVLAGVTVGAGAGELAERSQTALRYADVIQIPMQCPGGVGLEAPVLERPRYGVTLRVMSPDEALAVGLGSRTGALVTGVAAGGQADRAGLLAGDVIIAVGGKELAGLDDLEHQLRSLSPGNELALTVWRDGRSVELTLTPAPEAAP